MVPAWRFRFIVTSLVMCLPSTSSAEWIPNGVPLVELPNQQSRPAVVSDGAGGVIVAWDDARTSYAWDVYAQRLDRWGDVRWATNGVPVCVCTGYQTDPVLISDGQGGAIVGWNHNVNGYFREEEARARRLDANGAPVWDAEVAYDIGEWGYGIGGFVMTGDNAGGAQFVFVSGGGTDLYARRFGSTGHPAWLPSTIPIAVAPYEQWSPRIVTHDSGGMLIAWVDRRRSYYLDNDFIIASDLYAQRVDASGAVQWGAGGKPVDLDGVSEISLAADEAGGAFLAWNEGDNIQARRLDSNGNTLWHVAVCDEANSQRNPSAFSDGSGGVTIVWSDFRNGNEDVFGQRLDGSGNPLWAVNGMALDEGPDASGGRPIALPEGGFLLLLARSIQRYSADGVPAWTPGGVRLSSLDISQVLGGATLDHAGGVVVTWWDGRATSWDVFAQRFDLSHGAWGHPEAEIAAIADTPDDQGGTVTLNWTASGREDDEDPLVVEYSVWRRVTPGAVGPTSAEGWEHVLDVDATQQLEYVAVVPTTADSEPDSPVSNDFVVRAESVDPATYWESNVVSGSSIDNTPLAVAITSFEAKERDGAVVLSAEFRSDLGVEFVNVYRGVRDEPVSLRESRLLASGDRFEYVDVGVEAGATYRYQLGVGDADGEFFSALATVTVLGLTAALEQNHPNPFNPTTTIHYTLPAREHARLTVFDADGRRVRSLVDEVQGAGRHEATWDGRNQNGTAVGSGVYFYRLTAGKFSASKKMVLLK
jgi:hypothetical protein